MSGVRIDKWLWAARFFKTRSLAAQALDGGKARLNGERAKPSKDVRVGDRMAIQVGEQLFEITVLALSDRRGPATEARTLYAESEESVARRARQLEERRLCQNPGADIKGRPTKRDRRLIHRFTGE